jgi:nitric oxide reductase subunit B
VRTFGDVVFTGGAIAMALQMVLGLLGKESTQQQSGLGLDEARA